MEVYVRVGQNDGRVSPSECKQKKKNRAFTVFKTKHADCGSLGNRSMFRVYRCHGCKRSLRLPAKMLFNVSFRTR